MKRYIIALSILATPALAQQQPQYTPLNVTLLHQAESCEAAANTVIGQAKDQIAALTKQTEADKKTIADLTAKTASAPEKVDPQATK